MVEQQKLIKTGEWILWRSLTTTSKDSSNITMVGRTNTDETIQIVGSSEYVTVSKGTSQFSMNPSFKVNPSFNGVTLLMHSHGFEMK